MAKNTDKSFLIAFGAHLKKVRVEKNITQAQVAIDCDFDVSVISRIELGKVNTSLSNLKCISVALQIDIKDLFDFDDSTESETV